MNNQISDITWGNSQSIHLIRSPQPDRQPRQYLVYTVADKDTTILPRWHANRPRQFDIAVRYYSAPTPTDELFQLSDYVLTGGLSKFDSAAKFLACANLLERYRGYIFIDGDVSFDGEGIDTLLETVNAYGFDLAQAALSVGSYSSWPITLVRPLFDARETSFVEVMAPYFSRQALKLVLPTFTQSISGYGLDLAWSKILAKHKIGIIDRVVMHHHKSIDRADGAFYRYLCSLGIDPMEEQRKMREKYGIANDWRPYDVAGYVGNGQDPSSKLRVPLLQLGRRLVHYSSYQDRLAILAARALGTGKIVRLTKSIAT